MITFGLMNPSLGFTSALTPNLATTPKATHPRALARQPLPEVFLPAPPPQGDAPTPVVRQALGGHHFHSPTLHGGVYRGALTYSPKAGQIFIAISESLPPRRGRGPAPQWDHGNLGIFSAQVFKGVDPGGLPTLEGSIYLPVPRRGWMPYGFFTLRGQGASALLSLNLKAWADVGALSLCSKGMQDLIADLPTGVDLGCTP